LVIQWNNINIQDTDHNIIHEYLVKLGFTNGIYDKHILYNINDVTFDIDDIKIIGKLCSSRNTAARLRGRTEFRKKAMIILFSKLLKYYYGIKITYSMRETRNHPDGQKRHKNYKYAYYCNYKLQLLPIVKEYLIIYYGKIFIDKFNVDDDEMFIKSDIHGITGKYIDYINKL
jgi:hypothetical protein